MMGSTILKDWAPELDDKFDDLYTQTNNGHRISSLDLNVLRQLVIDAIAAARLANQLSCERAFSGQRRLSVFWRSCQSCQAAHKD